MILQHPTSGEKIRVRYGSITAHDLIHRQGYINVTPPPSEQQKESQSRWLARGRLELAKSNLAAVIKDQNFYQFQPNELAYLEKARDMIALKSLSFPLSKETHKRLKREANHPNPQEN